MSVKRPVEPGLANPRAQRVRAAAALTGRFATRKKAGLTLVEGPQAVRELVRYAPGAVVEIFACTRVWERYPEICSEAGRAGLVWHWATDGVVEAISRDARGIVATAALDELQIGAREFFTRPPEGFLAIGNEIGDPANAGAIVRAADCAGARAVIFTEGSTDAWSPKVIRGSAGSVFHLPVITALAWADLVEYAAQSGVELLATSGGANEPLFELGGLDSPHAWVFGNEARGLADEHLAQCGRAVAIGLYGPAQSLNVAMAATLCLYESARSKSSGAACK